LLGFTPPTSLRPRLLVSFDRVARGQFIRSWVVEDRQLYTELGHWFLFDLVEVNSHLNSKTGSACAYPIH